MSIRNTVAVIAGTLVAAAIAGPAHAAPTIAPSTRANALTAMHGEALAHAKYLAFAAQAARTHHLGVAVLFARTAGVELGDHFTSEARLIGFVGANADNLREAIAGEEYEANTMYPSFAKQAAAEGCDPAARLFTEIAADETLHAKLFREALEVVTNPGSSEQIPVGERAVPVPIPVKAPTCQGETLKNLNSAMGGEAFANAKYTLYAERARRTGQPRLARLFLNSAGTELWEHFAEEASLAGAVGPVMRNLGGAIAGETYEATTMYPSFAREAIRAGDSAAAALFSDIAGDEAMHARAFAHALACMR